MFVNTIQFSPVTTEGLCKAHPSSYEYREWWEEQKKRCIHGYESGGLRITGDHYFYLNFWKIKGENTTTGRKDLISPRFIDIDYEFFHIKERAQKEGKNLLVAKRRQIGFSEKCAALIGKEFSFFRHSQSIITAGEEKYSAATMRMVVRGLNDLKDTEFYKRRTPDTLEYCQAKYKVIEDGMPVWKGYQSEIYSLTSRNNSQSMIGKSPSFVFFEESGKFPGLIETYNYIKPALEVNGKKTGFALIVGTGGSMDTGADEFSQMFYDPQTYDLLAFDNEYSDNPDDSKKVSYFVPAWKFNLIDKEGNSLKESSIEKIMAEREEKRMAKNPSAYYNHITQMPMNPEECFMVTGGNMFNQAKLNTRFAQIKQSKTLSNMAQHGELEWTRDNTGRITGIEWIAKENGTYIILEHPEVDDATKRAYGGLYVGGTDSYDKDEANTSSSKGSCQIFKRFKDAESTSNLFVARVTARPRTAEEFWEMTAKLCYYYNAQNLIEYSNIGIFGWYERHNLDYMLKERPRIAYSNVKESKVNNRYGIDPNTRDYWLTAYRDYIEQNVDNMYDVEQIERAIKFKDEKGYNCDITISSSLCIVHNQDNFRITVKKKDVKPFEFFSFQSNKRGTFDAKFGDN